MVSGCTVCYSGSILHHGRSRWSSGPQQSPSRLRPPLLQRRRPITTTVGSNSQGIRTPAPTKGRPTGPEQRWRLHDADARSVANLRYPEQRRWRIYHAETGDAARIYQAVAVTLLHQTDFSSRRAGRGDRLVFKAKPLPPSGNGGDGTNTYPPRPRDGLGVPRWDLFWERSCWLRGSL